MVTKKARGKHLNAENRDNNLELNEFNMFTCTGTNWYVEHNKRVGLAVGLDCNTFRFIGNK